MNTFKVFFSNGDSLITGFNGTLKDAEKYYVGKYFNFGIENDIMTKGIKVQKI